MTKEQILDKIAKVKALADSGEIGERAKAEAMLKSLMEKYGISEEEIDSEKKEIYLLDTEIDLYIQLLVQIGHLVTGSDLKLFKLNKSKAKEIKELSKLGYGDATANVAFECTKAQFIEIKMMFDIYKEDMKRQLDIFVYAYFSKNGLLAEPSKDDSGNSKEPSQAEIDKAMKAAMMEKGIDKKQIYKMIENN